MVFRRRRIRINLTWLEATRKPYRPYIYKLTQIGSCPLRCSPSAQKSWTPGHLLGILEVSQDHLLTWAPVILSCRRFVDAVDVCYRDGDAANDEWGWMRMNEARILGCWPFERYEGCAIASQSSRQNFHFQRAKRSSQIRQRWCQSKTTSSSSAKPLCAGPSRKCPCQCTQPYKTLACSASNKWG